MSFPIGCPATKNVPVYRLIGVNDIDESLCEIFDHLRERGDPVRLVNVPEFVVRNVKYPEMFNFKNDRTHDEYILSISDYYPLKNMHAFRRRKVERQIARVGERNIVVKSLDLSSEENKDFLWRMAVAWQPRGINNYGKHELRAMRICIEQSEELGIENACLFVNGEMYGFCLYEIGSDTRYVGMRHIKATHVSTLGFELIAYMFAKWFAERGVLYGNIASDFGLMRLRMFMLTLGPVNFFRKYIIEPA
ncbi:hypothetical protein IRY61_03215 [Candidatus Saccharibacteria bacterium]|nr:hypothetical protein [Candidatus Saccharibacteria bacterium]